MPIGLYIHVPFCARKCIYCDFYSAPADEDTIEKYVQAVIRNIRAANQRYDTVYFGGGTPSLLSPSQIGRILDCADIAAGAEVSSECNPDSADLEKLKGFHHAGVNRISFGVQSFDDNELKMLHRLHDSEAAKNAVFNAQKAGFDNISCDLMLGLPYQDVGKVRENFAVLSSLPVSHVSAYMLKIEEGTPLYNDTELCKAASDDDGLADCYETAVSELADMGLFQYEISNFSRKGMECKHNLKYWRCGDYLGIGPSAHSCSEGKRFAVPKDTRAFIGSPLQETYITDDMPCTSEEKMMLSLRLCEGCDLLSCGFDDAERERVLKTAGMLEKHGLLTVSGSRIILTVSGFLMSNEIICRLEEAAMGE